MLSWFELEGLEEGEIVVVEVRAIIFQELALFSCDADVGELCTVPISAYFVNLRILSLSLHNK